MSAATGRHSSSLTVTPSPAPLLHVCHPFRCCCSRWWCYCCCTLQNASNSLSVTPFSCNFAGISAVFQLLLLLLLPVVVLLLLLQM
jgi:hypothetical protein